MTEQSTMKISLLWLGDARNGAVQSRQQPERICGNVIESDVRNKSWRQAIDERPSARQMNDSETPSKFQRKRNST